MRQAKQLVELQLIKWPKAILAILMIISMIAGGGATLATQMARINTLEQQLQKVEANSLSKDQAALIREMLKGIDEKMDIKFNNVDKRLDKIEKKLGN